MTDPQTQSTRVGVVAESGPDERRVALVPKAVASLVNRGVAVVVEAGAGERALLPDELYTAVGGCRRSRSRPSRASRGRR
ncbi:NAD(P) transhydrogenase subunit alpha [Mycobacterium tuberculosis]|uniref:proton-translocating NAD(P)(+) transhydrogenase n=1 Tax=Mycobacterium tuberculosis TaxID=1773 RepID=A0A654TR78_MYCTX|nr:NAD(P) transhydrogenase subunit alpha [Mycobacterium tuberculosis]